MDFNLTDEQRLLKDSAEKLLAKQYSFEQRRGYQAENKGWSDKVWSLFAEQGLLALPFSSEHGGMDMGAVEMMTLMEEMGKAIVLEPYLSCIVMAGNLLKNCANTEQAADIIPSLIDGSRLIVPALDEAQSRYCLNHVASHAHREGNSYVLNGVKTGVEHGFGAQQFIVSARSSGQSADIVGISLFLVDANAPGVTIRAYKRQDGIAAADISLNDVKLTADQLLGSEGGAYSALEAAREVAIAAIAAESVGLMSAALDLTTDYIQQREQFGQVIGSFQALQHRAAEMLVELEQARSAAIYAALMLGETDAVQRSRAISEVKWQIDKSARIVAQGAVQLHGGIGVSEEAAVGHYFRRLTMLGLQFGDSEFHCGRLCQQVVA
jgi:alkylation response protein AidB-like acyl-CoA dehydrogenase